MFFKSSVKSIIVFSIAFIVLLFASNFSFATGVPNFINYQGKLTSTSGVPLTGTYSMIFTIYEAESGGTSQWTETQSSVTVNKGIFSVILGSGADGNPETTGDNNPISPYVFYDSNRWIGVKVGTDSEMTPRQRLTSVPYAYSADNLGGGKVVVDSAGRVGIGTTSPEERLHIKHAGAAELLIDASDGTPDNGNAFLDLVNDAGNRGNVSMSRSGLTNPYPNTLSLRNDFPGGGIIFETAGGAERMFINGNGNIGIGTVNPTDKLTVRTGGGGHGIDLIHNDGTNPGSGKIFVSNDENQGGNALYLGTTEALALMSIMTGGANLGNVGIGTSHPAYKLDVEGSVQAQAYYTGDIVFQKDGKKLWRMFEDEKGLYLENLNNKKVSRIFLEEDIKAMKEEIVKEVMGKIQK